MVQLSLQDRSREQGFTLVELAVVMIIIGLLIGGILKGQELIGNAEVAATVSQLKGVDAAVSSFRDKYDEFPGDMLAADTRLAGVPAANSGNGDQVLSAEPGVTQGAATEAAYFWEHLSAADMLTGDQNNSTIETRINNANIGVGYVDDGNVASGLGGNFLTGHYLAVTDNQDGSMAAGLMADQAARIDRKLDNGDGLTGSVRGAGTQGSGTGNCATAAGVYNEANAQLVCGIYVRFQS